MRNDLATRSRGRNRDSFGINRLQHEIDRMFDDFIGVRPRGSPGGGGTPEFLPSVDVQENSSEYQLNFDLPGISKDEINIELHGNRLVVSGERRYENKQEDKDSKWISVERSYGSFGRSFELPSSVDRENIQANYEDGVLKVIIPKSEEAKPRQIKVGASGKGILRRLGDAVSGTSGDVEVKKDERSSTTGKAQSTSANASSSKT